MRILMLGNSFTACNDLPQMLASLQDTVPQAIDDDIIFTQYKEIDISTYDKQSDRRWHMKRILCTILVVFSVLLAGQTVYADDSSVTWDIQYPDEISCGTTTHFHIEAEGEYESIKYQLQKVEDQAELAGSYSRWVIDVSRQSYQNSPDFDFTFYASGTYDLKFYILIKNADGKYTTQNKTIRITIDDPDYPTVNAKADQVAEECLNSGCQSDFDKAVWLHDWILTNCKYDSSYQYCGAEGALARGLGTCESYYGAYKILLDRVGIENKRATGNGHVWNVTKLDGKWYQIDCTWDDNGSVSLDNYQSHLYFGLPDDIMTLVHSDHAVDSSCPCDSYEDNYFIRTGGIVQWMGDFMSRIQSNLEKGTLKFDISFTDSIPQAYMNVIYRLVAHQLESAEWEVGSQKHQLQVEFETPEYSAGVFHVTAEELSHNYEHRVVAAQVGIAGKESDVCTRCGDEQNIVILPALSPRSTSIMKLTASKKAFTVKWSKRSYTGYQIRYSLKSSMSGAKTVTVKDSSHYYKKIRKLKSKRKYYVQVRTYKTVNGKNYYSSWSSKKRVKTK